MIRYEMLPDKVQARAWRVEGMDYDESGTLTGDHQSIALFSGDGAEGRAHEYFDWLHERGPAAEQAQDPTALQEAERRLAIRKLADALAREDPAGHLSLRGAAVAVRLLACRELGIAFPGDPPEAL